MQISRSSGFILTWHQNEFPEIEILVQTSAQITVVPVKCQKNTSGASNFKAERTYVN